MDPDIILYFCQQFVGGSKEKAYYIYKEIPLEHENHAFLIFNCRLALAHDSGIRTAQTEKTRTTLVVLSRLVPLP